MNVIALPTRKCVMCGALATEALDLIDEAGQPVGQKFFCADCSKHFRPSADEQSKEG